MWRHTLRRCNRPRPLVWETDCRLKRELVCIFAIARPATGRLESVTRRGPSRVLQDSTTGTYCVSSTLLPPTTPCMRSEFSSLARWTVMPWQIICRDCFRLPRMGAELYQRRLCRQNLRWPHALTLESARFGANRL